MKTKKIVSLLVTMCLMLSLFAVPTYAAEQQFDISANGDGSIIATFNSETGVLDITGTGEIKHYTDSPFAGILTNIKTINVGEGITGIGSNLFYIQTYTGVTLRNVESVSLPSTLKNIYVNAFAFLGYYNPLEELILPENLSFIQSRAFYCISVNNIKILSKETQNIQNNAFESLSIPNPVIYLY